MAGQPRDKGVFEAEGRDYAKRKVLSCIGAKERSGEVKPRGGPWA